MVKAERNNKNNNSIIFAFNTEKYTNYQEIISQIRQNLASRHKKYSHKYLPIRRKIHKLPRNNNANSTKSIFQTLEIFVEIFANSLAKAILAGSSLLFVVSVFQTTGTKYPDGVSKRHLQSLY